MDYETFLNSKKLHVGNFGKIVAANALHPIMHGFRGDMVLWAVRKGRAAIFADVGLGKTTMQLEWARLLNAVTLIVAPLAVSQQTVAIARDLLGMEVRYIRSKEERTSDCKVYITNYEMVENVYGDDIEAVILDESSILKNFSGVTKKALVRMFKNTPYKLACTATPAPNDILEIGNHSEFLGIMASNMMTSIFFIHGEDDNGGTQTYRLKKHAHQQFYQWLSSWAVALRKPSDLGYDDAGYDLPALNTELITVDADYTPAGMLKGFGVGAISATDAKKVRRATINDRAAVVTEMVNNSTEQWLIWTALNEEAETLNAAIPGSVNVHGGLSIEQKVSGIQGFVSGDIRVLITKPSIAGMGINMQNCHNMIFFGVDYSWESFYQSVGRIYRFGQKADRVNVYVVISEQERPVYQSIEHKGKEARKMTSDLINASREFMEQELHNTEKQDWTYREDVARGRDWTLLLGDSCQRMQEIESDSVGLSVYSPPFSNIYIYSATERDLGNSKTQDEFMAHYQYIIEQNLRITMPGRIAAVHIQDKKQYANRDGQRGIYPMSDDIVQAYIKAGWVYRARITIDKNPQLVATRNKDTDLLFVTGKRDSTALAPMHTDYLLIFKKPGENPAPVRPYESGEMSEDDWILWARAVWYGIKETNVLNTAVAKANEDERHICPLQLDLIERCIRLWSNKGDTVFSPFAGIGSELYSAVKLGRKGLGIELKGEYYQTAIRNLKQAETASGQLDLFSWAEQQKQSSDGWYEQGGRYFNASGVEIAPEVIGEQL